MQINSIVINGLEYIQKPASLLEVISNKDNLINELEQALTESRAEIYAKVNTIKDLERKLQLTNDEADEQLEQKDIEISELEEQVDELKSAIEDISYVLSRVS